MCVWLWEHHGMITLGGVGYACCSFMTLAQKILKPLPKKRRHKYMLCEPRHMPEVSAGSVNAPVPRILYNEGECLPPYVSRISDRLFLGNVAAAVSEPLLRGHGITHLLTVMDIPIPLELRPRDRTILYVASDDLPEAPLHRQFHLASDWMHRVLEEEEEPVPTCILVHCFMGISRSATLILAYWIKYGPLFADLEQAYEMLLTLRPIVNPNRGFRHSLEAWWTLHRILPFLYTSFPALLSPVRSCIFSYLIGDSDYFHVKQ